MMNRLTRAAQDVLRERARQIENHGYDDEHDDGHDGHEIAAAAAYYAMPPGAREWPATETGYGETFGEAIAPENWTMKDYGDRRRELVVAAALLLAEIERMDRAASGVTPCEQPRSHIEGVNLPPVTPRPAPPPMPRAAGVAPSDRTQKLVPDPACKTCRGEGRYVAGYSGREDDGNAPLWEDCDCFIPAGVKATLKDQS